MANFIENYRVMSRKNVFVENFDLKNNKHLLFCTIPPTQVQYPNPGRIAFCLRNKIKLKKIKPISFDLDLPTKEDPTFRVFGFNKYFHQNTEFKTLSNRTGSKSTRTKWEEYIKIPEAFLKLEREKKEAENKNQSSQKKKEARLRMEEAKKRKKEMRLSMRRLNQHKSMDEITKSTLIFQKYAKAFVARQRLTKMRKMRKKRENICRELLKTEEDYVNNLKVLRRVYMEPLGKMSKRSKFLTQQDFTQIFSGLEGIINLNDRFAGEIKHSIFNEEGEFVHHTKLSEKILFIAPYLKMYRSYCSKYQKTLDRLEILRKNKKFGEMLLKMDRDKNTSKLGMSSYLIMPIQRVPRYKLLLRDMIKATDNGHGDFDGLHKSAEQIEETATFLNDAMKEIESSEEVIEIQKKFVGTKNFVIHQPHRKFIKEGLMFKGTTRGKNPIYVHLFNDVIVFSTKRGNNQFEFQFSLSLRSALFFFSNEPLRRRCLKINQIALTTDDQKKRDEWLMTLLRTKKDFIEKKKIKVKKSNEGEKKMGRSTTVDVAIYESKKEELNLTLDDCIAIVKNEKKPVVMLKYCATSTKFFGKMKIKKPHLRKFIVSGDETKIMWGSPKKGPNEASINLRDVKELVVGQNTVAFKKDPKPSVEGISFSLLYEDGEVDMKGNWTGKTLDLICQTKLDYEIWTRALRFLIADRGRTTHKRNKDYSKNKGKFTKYLAINLNEEKAMKKLKFREQGDSYSWGKGEGSALGHGSDRDIFTPKVHMHMLYLNVKSMFSGLNCAHVLLTNGRVVNFGENASGKLGHGDTSNYIHPTPLDNLKNHFIVSVATGSQHTFFVEDNGTVWGCGSSEHGQLCDAKGEKKNLIVKKPVVIFKKGQLGEVEQMVCGNNHCGLVNKKGEFYTWGNGEDGQLGHGVKEKCRRKPKKVEGVLKGKHIIQAAFGCWHSVVVDDAGDVYVWGNGSFGQLGRKTIEQFDEEKKIAEVKGMQALVPEKVESLSQVVQVSAGTSHSGVVTSSGACFMWGSASYGQVGVWTGKIKKLFLTPMQIIFLRVGEEKVFLKNNSNIKFKQISCGANHNLGIVERKDNGQIRREVFSWGGGTYGRLGITNSESDQHIPHLLSFFSEKEVRSVDCGEFMSSCVCAHQWVPDEDYNECMNCNKRWTTIRRRHHCRNCGGLFCDNCSKKKVVLLKFGFDKRVRVCGNCHKILKKQQLF